MRRNAVLSVIAGLFVSLAVAATLNDYGIAWDEPVYFGNADKIASWFSSPTANHIDETFSVGEGAVNIHPPFVQTVAAATHTLLTKRFAIVNNTVGYRMAIMPFVFLLTAAVAWESITVAGTLAGFLAAVMFSLMPHVFYLSHIYAMDYPAAALWFLTVAAFRRGLRSPLWLYVSALLLGVSLLTKLHGFLLFIPLTAMTIAYANDRKTSLKTNRLLIIGAVMTAIPALLYIAGWPWLWANPVERFIAYLTIQSGHGSVPVLYMGNVFAHAPWHYVPVILTVTSPIVFLVFVTAGIFASYRTNRHIIFWLANGMFPLLFFMLPPVYRYDGIRLFLPALPFFAVVWAAGLKHVLDMLPSGLPGRMFRLACISVTVVAVAIPAITSHPYQYAYYNAFVGGTRGAADRGFETEYWGSSLADILPWMNDHASAKFCAYPVTDPFYYYQAMGQLRVSSVDSGKECEYLIVLMRPGLFVRNAQLQNVIATHMPVQSVTYGSVPLVNVYRLITDREH